MMKKQKSPPTGDLPQGDKEARKQSAGVVAFSTILVLSAIIVEVGVAASILTYMASRANYGMRLSNEAFAAARAGVDDAVIRIVRTRFYPTCTATYTIAVTQSASADVTVQNVACSSASEDRYVVTSVGRALGKRRMLQATLGINDATREVRTIAIAEPTT
ncbi:MAG: hypothetical protein HYV25_02710 [Candidatus Harrisonbacteria bacterium]|nr:hypothetical protein [Candidatus Harrisonbacteria bacterium]